jgi:glycerol-3-phosphate dehydrogenase (NAD(P)+)
MKITVLGAGAWGTALARLLAVRDHDVTLWDFFPETIELMRQTGRNERYLPGIELPPNLRSEADISRALAGAGLVVVAAVSKGFRPVTRALGNYDGIVVSVTKGIEFETGLTMTDILKENSPRSRVVAMSGPTLALEVARGIPAAIVAASTDPAAAQTVQAVFHSPAFRVYTSPDIHGVGSALATTPRPPW